LGLRSEKPASWQSGEVTGAFNFDNPSFKGNDYEEATIAVAERDLALNPSYEFAVPEHKFQRTPTYVYADGIDGAEEA
jgi:hypothetical protein